MAHQHIWAMQHARPPLELGAHLGPLTQMNLSYHGNPTQKCQQCRKFANAPLLPPPYKV
ncbi:hypothetical protein Syun_017920 [Stephania yunnanensis]|uniref:Uncharacterized protein n=1 Tax=Stephania yunnanensis TaxID=152371 RepID=A0AAP0ISR8_9MAGN